jgi:hypothetical protein
MSCTHDCGCTPEIRDARTDEWVQIAPESARAATLTPAPEPVDPDAAAVEAIVTAYRRSPECSTHAVFGEAMLDHLRDQGFDVTPRAEQ